MTSWSVVFLLFIEIFIYGANRTDLAIGFAGIWFAVLAAILAWPWARRSLERVPLRWPAAAFGLTILMAALSLTPWAPGGPHPAWSWVPGAIPTASIDPYATQVEILKLLGLAAVFLVGVVMGADDERAKQLIRAVLAVGLAYSAWAFVNQALHLNFPFGFFPTAAPTRLSASLVSANSAATLFGALTILNLIDLARRVERSGERGLSLGAIERLAGEATWPIVALILSVFCLTMTLSRAGIAITLGLCVVLVGGGVFAMSRRGALAAPALAIGVIAGGIACLALAFNIGPLADRLAFVDASYASRAAMVDAHWKAFTAAPWSGYGLGSFVRVNAMIMNHANIGALHGVTALHDVYVQWLEEGGIACAAPMFLCIGLILARIMLGVMERPGMRAWLAGLTAVAALFLLHGLTDYALQLPALAALFSLALGVGYGASIVRRVS